MKSSSTARMELWISRLEDVDHLMGNSFDQLQPYMMSLTIDSISRIRTIIGFKSSHPKGPSFSLLGLVEIDLDNSAILGELPFHRMEISSLSSTQEIIGLNSSTLEDSIFVNFLLGIFKNGKVSRMSSIIQEESPSIILVS